MHTLRRVVAMSAVGALALLALVNVLLPPSPREDPPAHAEAIRLQQRDDLHYLAVTHGNAKVRHYFGTYLTIGHVTGGGTLVGDEAMFGSAHSLAAFAGLTLSEQGTVDQPIDASVRAELLQRPHTRGTFSAGRPDTEIPVTVWAVVHPTSAAQRGGVWRAVREREEEFVIIAPDDVLDDIGVAWH